MESIGLDKLFAPSLVPIIMLLQSFKELNENRLDLLHSSVLFGITSSALYCMIHYQVKQSVRCRVKLTLITAALLTAFYIIATVGFHCIRVNLPFEVYQLPHAVRNLPLDNQTNIVRHHFHSDFIPALIILSSTQVCQLIQHYLLDKAKRTFGHGEAILVSQLTAAAFLAWALTLYTEVSGAGPFEASLTTRLLLNLGVINSLIVGVLSYAFVSSKSTMLMYALLAASFAVSYARANTLIRAVSNLDPLTWLIEYIFSTHQRISLFSLWLSTLTACVSFSTSWTQMVGQTNSLVRKVFHLAVCVVFVSGFNQDVEFMRFASGAILIVLYLLETIRATQLKPLGPYLERVCRSLRGKWDNKYLTLSHIYLLVGMFTPLWLGPSGLKPNKLVLSSGLISVGVGDTAAAIVGTFLGKTKLTEKSGKTLEGLVGNILSMLLFKMVWIGYTDLIGDFGFAMAAVLTALVEVMTKNCDNLLLPLVMMVLIEIFHHQ